MNNRKGTRILKISTFIRRFTTISRSNVFPEPVKIAVLPVEVSIGILERVSVFGDRNSIF